MAQISTFFDIWCQIYAQKALLRSFLTKFIITGILIRSICVKISITHILQWFPIYTRRSLFECHSVEISLLCRLTKAESTSISRMESNYEPHVLCIFVVRCLGVPKLSILKWLCPQNCISKKRVHR